MREALETDSSLGASRMLLGRRLDRAPSHASLPLTLPPLFGRRLDSPPSHASLSFSPSPSSAHGGWWQAGLSDDPRIKAALLVLVEDHDRDVRYFARR